MAKKEGFTLKQKANLARGYKVVTADEPGRDEWYDIQVSMRRMVNELGEKSVMEMGDHELADAMKRVGRMECPLVHTKAMRAALVKGDDIAGR